MKIHSRTGVGLHRRLLAAFSLTEVTVGIGIVATAMGALLSGLTGGFFTMHMTRENIRATQIMLEKVETIRLYSWSQINTPGFIPTNFTASYDPQSTNAGVVYQGTLTISPTVFNVSYSNDIRQVIVRLNWKTGKLPRSREFYTLISRNGLQNYIY